MKRTINVKTTFNTDHLTDKEYEVLKTRIFLQMQTKVSEIVNTMNNTRADRILDTKTKVVHL